MFRHPVVITSLEEDMKRLGLLDETGYSSTQGDSTPGDKHDEPSGLPHEGEGPAKGEGPGPVPMKEKKKLRGMPDPVRGKMEKTLARDKDSEEPESDEPEDDEEPEGDSDDDETPEESVYKGHASVLEVVAALRKRTQETIDRRASKHTAKHEAKKSPKVESRSLTGRSAQLIEDVQEILSSVATTRREEAVKAFANISIIAEMLRRAFLSLSEETSDKDLAEAAKAFDELSEDAAQIARAVEGLTEDVDSEALEEAFREQMDALLNGLDFYSDMAEDDDAPPPPSDEPDGDEEEPEGDDDEEEPPADDKEPESEPEGQGEDTEEDAEEDCEECEDEPEEARKPKMLGKAGRGRAGMGAGSGGLMMGKAKREDYKPFGSPGVKKKGKKTKESNESADERLKEMLARAPLGEKATAKK